jgi:hypothetical protein
MPRYKYWILKARLSLSIAVQHETEHVSEGSRRRPETTRAKPV